MNPENNTHESSYRPSSPDLSGFNAGMHNAPLPRLTRIPSYHQPVSSSDPNNFPPGYSFSPRGSYDASPFFSPSTTNNPAASYFNSRPSQPQYQSTPSYSTSPQAFRTPGLPVTLQSSPPSQPRTLGQSYNNIPEYQPNQSYPPSNQLYKQQHPSAAIGNFQSSANNSTGYDDMARTRRQQAVEANHPDYNETATSRNSSIPQPEEPQATEPVQPVQSTMPTAASDPTLGIDVRTKFPVARIKRIMQADEEVGKVAQATPTAVSKALELFMIQVVTHGATEARNNGSKRVTAQHLKTALMNDGQFDFLNEICENVPDEASKKGRAKSEAKSEDSEEDIKPTKGKGKGGKKRKADSEDDSG